jgi:poly(3-hydroxybutyrate) depolymerase
MKKAIFPILPIVLSVAFTAASAYTLRGSVTDKSDSSPIHATVKLLKRGKSAETDRSGAFVIQEDDEVALQSSRNAVGHFSILNGILNFTQGSSAPVQVKVFDMKGGLVLTKTLQGSGSIDLASLIRASGNFVAEIQLGSAHEKVRFSSYGKTFGAMGSVEKPALYKEGDDGDTLRVVAADYDTLFVPLSNLDTTVNLKLDKVVVEQTYAFGYAMGNAPTPSKGCGKENKLKDNFTFTGGGIEHEIYLTLPENYDKDKPYRLVFGMHYMGGSAKNVATREAYYGLRNQKGAKENTIFVAPHGYTDENGKENPWRCGDDKDHIFFDEFLTYLNDNLCVDTSRVFSVGFSFGAMFSNSLAQDFQHRLRGVVVFATMDQVIYLPKNKGLPIAWMGTVGMDDPLCTPKLGRSARDRILKNNGKPDADGNFTDARNEKAEEYSGTGNHVCYDYKTVDPRFPVKWCTFNGEHAYNASDDGKVWTTPTAWEFITQF